MVMSMRHCHYLCLVFLMLPLAACRSGVWEGFPQVAPDGLVWPAPPEPPRVGWVAEIRSHEDLFTEGGGLRTITRLFTGQPDTALVRPHAVAVHPEGGLLVSDPGRAVVHYYCWSRRAYHALGLERPEGLPSPVGVAALPDGRILVADSRLAQILIYDNKGESLGEFASDLDLHRPAGLAVDAVSQQVVIADVTAHQIILCDFEGRVIRRVGTRGGAPGQFNFPTHLAESTGGRLAVSDSMNFRVQTLTVAGEPLATIGELGAAPGKFSKPKGVAFDGAGRVIVVEGLYDALQFFTPDGQLLLSVGGSGQAPGQFWLPAGCCVDSERGLLFVADSYNRRVQVFRLLTGESP